MAIPSLPLVTNERIQLIDRAINVVEDLGYVIGTTETGDLMFRQYLPEERACYKCALQLLSREFVSGAREDRPAVIQTEKVYAEAPQPDPEGASDTEEEEAVCCL